MPDRVTLCPDAASIGRISPLVPARCSRRRSPSPGLILASAFIGFGSLAQEAGFTLAETAFMTGRRLGAAGDGRADRRDHSGASLLRRRIRGHAVLGPADADGGGAGAGNADADARATGCSICLSHFVAVTSWVIAMERFPRSAARPMRTAFYGGLGSTLVLTNHGGCRRRLSSSLGSLPRPVTAALLFLTPIYFLTSLWGSARERAGHVAMILGHRARSGLPCCRARASTCLRRG